MTSTDGVNWTDEAEVLSAQAQLAPQGDGPNIVHASVMYEPSVGYTMWYTVADLYPSGDCGATKIWRATSSDGLTWSDRQLVFPYVNETWEGAVGPASIVKEADGTYTMFYNAFHAYYENGYCQWAYDGSIGIAKSVDSITWTDRRTLLRPADLSASITSFDLYPYHFKDTNGSRYLYFTYYNTTDAKWHIGRIQLTEIHDVAVKSIWLSKTAIGQNYTACTNATVANLGDTNKTLRVSVRAVSTDTYVSLAVFTDINLTSGDSTILSTTWNTTSVPIGNYTIHVVVLSMPDRDMDKNFLLSDIVKVTIPGDVDGNFDVNIYDIVRVCSVYGSRRGEPEYASNCDLNDDGKMDIYDVVLACVNYGQTIP
jgi:hypothetical protein